MKILYIHPDTTELRDSQSVIPIGMVSIANSLIEEGYKFKGISIPLEKKLNKNFDYKKIVLEYKPNIVMVDLHWAIYSYSTIEICREIKKINKSIITIIGGITSSIFFKEIMDSYNFIDFICKGDSQEPVKLLINKIKNNDTNFKTIPNISYRKNNRIYHNKIEYHISDFDSYYYDNYDFLEHNIELFKVQSNHKNNENDDRLAWIPAGHGCKYNCSYCGGNNKMFNEVFDCNKMMNYDMDKIIDTMENLNKKYKVNIFGITHDFGIFNKNYYNELLFKIQNLKFKPGIYNYLFQLPSLEYMKEFLNVTNEEKTIVGIPAVCGNEKDRIKNGKNFTNKELFEFLNLFIGKKTKVEIYFIANPFYGKENFNDTNSLITEIKKEFKNKVNLDISCGFEIIQPYSKKHLNKVNEPSLLSFDDYYYRYSPQFLEDLKKGKGISYLVGENEFDPELSHRIKKINEVINEEA